MNCKYENEGRFGLGCAMIQPVLTDGTILEEEGRTCPLFDYSGKTIISINDYEKKMKFEFERIKSLSAKSTAWVTNPRMPGVIYDEEPIFVLKGIGNKKKNALIDQNIKTVKDIKTISDEKANEITGIARKNLESMRSQAALSIPGSPPPLVDHRKSENPYLSKYGNQWEFHFKQSTAMSSSVVITDYIEHMMMESRKIMRGTVHEDSWMIYHDSLSLMTAKRTKEWMRKKDYLKRWILPSRDLYDDHEDLKNYRSAMNPPGNSPELMPWDTHLNKDLHDCHDVHVLYTKYLPDESDEKHCGSTPKRIAKSYSRLVRHCPGSRRIMQDVNRIIESLQAIVEAQGVVVNGLGDRKGRRHQKLNEGESRRGGRRTRKEYEPGKTYLDEAAKRAREKMNEKSVHDFNCDAIEIIENEAEAEDDLDESACGSDLFDGIDYDYTETETESEMSSITEKTI